MRAARRACARPPHRRAHPRPPGRPHALGRGFARRPAMAPPRCPRPGCADIRRQAAADARPHPHPQHRTRRERRDTNP
ncbi:MAG: hypothetical protein D6832_02320 [Alphaproteobacteria bacterium]|nr:MAG: hypothetical protein D6832_02320 [Alphaproteobacteria bacterium]